MKDYYKVLKIEYDPSTRKDNINEESITNELVLTNYKLKIARFNNLPFLTKQMISEIKTLKEAYYILSDDTRRNKYNKIYKTTKLTKLLADDSRVVDNTKIYNRMFNSPHIR